LIGGSLEPLVRWTVLGLYFACLGVMTVYGFHRWYLVWLYLRHRRQIPRPAARFAELPRLTVQLPLYNEMYVARRLIDAVCALDYPRDRLEIQVLDDSTDETTDVVAAAALIFDRSGAERTRMISGAASESPLPFQDSGSTNLGNRVRRSLATSVYMR